MAANGISTLVEGDGSDPIANRAARQAAKLDLAQTKRQAGGDTNAIAYRANNVYDIQRLSLPYGYEDAETVNPLIQTRPWVNFGAGLFRSTYSGYFAGDVNWFASQTPTATAQLSSFTNIAVGTTTSYQYLGYFRAPASGTFTFWTNSDDASYMWVGPTASSGFTTGNALVDNGGEHAAQDASGTIELNEGTLYAIRIQTGNNGGPGSVSISYAAPSGSRTYDFTGIVFYNEATNGL